MTGMHTRTTGTVSELYLTLANDVMNAGLEKYPMAERRLQGIVS